MQRDSRKIAAILAADVVEYSRLMGTDEAGALAALKVRRGIFQELVGEFGGREFGSVGDSLMAEFDSAVNALSCALEIQQRVAGQNAPLPQAARMRLRIGVNLGDVIEEQRSVFGDAVNVAARLQALAKPGGVLISGPVYDQVHLKIPARYVAAGMREVKNILEPVRTYQVLPAAVSGMAGRLQGARARRVLRAPSENLSTEAQASPTLVVDPREGTVAGPGGIARLEPKVMGVLVALARQAGRVASRDELFEEVWPGVVVTEHTLSRCIYQLRNELGKVGSEHDPSGFNPIETLPKRGYRLLARVVIQASAGPPVPSASYPQRLAIPFVVGQWVRGERFYGRTAQIREILTGPRNCIWLLGTRRVGKTSLLKQIEYIEESSPDRRRFPIYWDFQGAATAEELHLNLADALLDADERLDRIGIRLDEVQADNLFASVERLRRRLRVEGLGLLLLCDEVEQLIQLRTTDPLLLGKLRHVLQTSEEIRTVLASTIRLWELARYQEDTSPFLHGFTPPLYIERLSDDEARSLIAQSHLEPQDRPEIPDDAVEIIRDRCDNHPYLLQLLCKRFLEAGHLDEAIEQVATDRMVSHFFSVDFAMLSSSEQETVRRIGERRVAAGGQDGHDPPADADQIQGALRRLENLGFVRRESSRRFSVANYFFSRWLREAERAPAGTGGSADANDGDSEVGDRR